MSNIKRVKIEAVVEFDYISKLSPEDAKTLFVWTCSPLIGLSLHHESAGSYKNHRGGTSSLFRLTIEGEEAIPYRAIDTILAMLNKVGIVNHAEAIDIEN